ncbi:beta-N-acetylhexosaminidase [Microbacterium koreense]|uniref:beta-N-acetylhexosaminidase n=1 Tax=Microbacterium koreense TaxID=323761 RepID=A0ABW2ZV67_9MICO
MTAPLVPLPAVVQTADAAGFHLVPTTTVSGPGDARAALAEVVRRRTGITLTTASDADIVLDIEPGGAPESYRLRVDAASVSIVGADAAGLFYGMQTLAQLITHDTGDWSIPAARIDDAPRFGYRGVMLDVARHFQPVATVFAFIDRAASLKFNMLHLHLTDDQGWRLQMDSRPLLTERASSTSVGGDAGGFYTKADYRAIVEYAAERHMTVVPEVDLPGHTHAVGVAYPDIAEPPVMTDEIRDAIAQFGGEDPRAAVPYEGLAVGFSSLRIRDERTYEFVADVLGELAALTPGPYLHIGGDEALGTAAGDYADFMERATQIVDALGKTPLTWHEAGAVDDLHDATVGQYWGFVSPTDGMDERARRFVRNGSRVILSPADAVYLDMKPTADADLGLTWANGPTSVERAYRWEPTAVIDGIGEDDILGIEAALWTETIRDLADLDRMAFPRIAAAAEASWSPRDGADRTWTCFRERVGGLAPLWHSLGIGFDESAEIPWQKGRP